MRTMIVFLSILIAHAALARHEPTSPAAEVPSITADRAAPQLLPDYNLATEEDCAKFATLALQADPQSIETFLSCVLFAGE